MKEKRRKDRIEIVLYISVYERGTDRLIGYVSDINAESALILTEKGLDTDSELALKIETVLENSDYLSVDAKCVRCEYDENIEMFECGFEFTLISENDKEQIFAIAEKLFLAEQTLDI